MCPTISLCASLVHRQDNNETAELLKASRICRLSVHPSIQAKHKRPLAILELEFLLALCSSNNQRL